MTSEALGSRKSLKVGRSSLSDPRVLRRRSWWCSRPRLVGLRRDEVKGADILYLLLEGGRTTGSLQNLSFYFRETHLL